MKINLKRRKDALAQIRTLMADSKNVLLIHYSCESFYDRTDGSSPKITSIAVRKLNDGQTRSFSIHKEAELQSISKDDIEKSYDKLEKSMLKRFYEFVSKNEDKTFVHWNMRDENFGFAAIELRYQILGGKPYVIQDDKKQDLARLLIDAYGVGYIEHPRLLSIVKKNKITDTNFLSGEKEAQAFKEKNYIKLHQSTLRKVDIFANILQRVADNHLKTNTSYWQLNGGLFLAIFNFFYTNPYIGGIIALASLVGLIQLLVNIIK